MLSFRIGHVIEHYFFDIILCIPEISFYMSKCFMLNISFNDAFFSKLFPNSNSLFY